MTQSASHKSHAQDALAGLRRWQLERNDEIDPGGRVYIDSQGTVYHSVTRILGATAPEAQQKALQNWLERPGSEGERQMAAERGTQTHNHAEYILKTARKLAIQTANKRNAFKTGSDGLERTPRGITTWAMQKAIQGAPSPAWSASGYARGLRHWIEANVTAIHSIEFSVHHPAGFAGSADGLLDIAGTLTLCDWKTTRKSIHGDMSSILEGYKHQCGAYSLGLRHLTGIEVPQAAIVLARRTGPPQTTIIGGRELREAEAAFLERVKRYFASLTAGS